MYLFVFPDMTVRAVNDNLSIADVLALKAKTVRIFTVGETCKEVIVTDKEVLKIPVDEASVLTTKDGRIHHP